MRKFFVLIILGFYLISAQAQNFKDAVMGIWLSEDGKGKVQIYKIGETYYGKLCWLKEPIDPNTNKPKLDDENGDDDLAKRPLLGAVILTDFIFKDGFWQAGEIYDPEAGKTYDCKMWLSDDTHLEIKGYWHFISRTDTWTKSNL